MSVDKHNMNKATVRKAALRKAALRKADEIKMKRLQLRQHLVCAALIAMTAFVASCNDPGDDVSQVQTNLVSKEIFEGDWWYSQTAIDVDGDEALASLYGVFEGAMDNADLGVDKGQSLHMARVRWVIDEDYLYAYRAYELIRGGNDDAEDDDYLGEPLAAYAIEAHVDIRKDYSAITGEETNVTVENTSDRRWYERNFMRVDWSRNAISNFYVGAQAGSVQTAPLLVQEGGPEEFPDSWKPQFVTVGQERGKEGGAAYRWLDEWTQEEDSTVHYMSFVTQQFYEPGETCLIYGTPCQTAAITARTSFLRVPPNHQYAVEVQNNDEFDKFGLFRTYQRSYARGGKDRETQRIHCFDDGECGVGGKCDASEHICVGGLTEDYGETDFLAHYRPRHDFFKESFDGRSCVVDWECDNRYGHEREDGIDGAGPPVDRSGSVCDVARNECTIPMKERELRTVAYHLNPGYPKHLVRAAFQVMGEWNESFMRGMRNLRGENAPTRFNRTPVSCQSDDPTDYCFCGSPEDDGGSCAWRYDPFSTPQQRETQAGDPNDPAYAAPYDCYVRGPDGWTEPSRPQSYDEYPDDGTAYQYEFVGDECLFILHANSCDKDPSQPCEELGDIRFQFFNYISHGAVAFGGVSIPKVDPTTGELITSNANMGATSVEAVGSRAVNWFPVLRCQGPNGCAEGEEGADVAYFNGEDLRDYQEAKGRVEHPVAVAAAGEDGYTPAGEERPGLRADALEEVAARADEMAAYASQLQGAEGRTNIFQERLKNLKGTAIEERLMKAMGDDLMFAKLDMDHVADDVHPEDERVIDRISPFRSSGLDLRSDEDKLWEKLEPLNFDPPVDIPQRSRFWEYYAEAFRGRPAGEASIRMQQEILRAVMLHEIGHSVGLRHNFGGSADRNNYLDGYFNIVFSQDGETSRAVNALPRYFDYDRTSRGGNSDGRVLGDEIKNYTRDLRDARNRRAEAGIGLTMSSSIMDYHGDLSDQTGLGRYDTAAALWNHFNAIEAYQGDPYHDSDDSVDGIERPDRTPRVFWQYYPGGGTCKEDAHCPYSSGKVLTDGQAIHQRCVQNPRQTTGTITCRGQEDCVCSSFEQDLEAYVDGEAFRDPVSTAEYFPVEYLFCTDRRAGDISWCSRFDAGESFQEIIDHHRRNWQESYPRAYYRRFRRGGASKGNSRGAVIDAVKIFQHFYFRYFYEPDFRSNDGALGINDQYYASLDAMNWLIEMSQLPRPGSYKYDADNNIYRFMGEEMDMAGASTSVPVGAGYPMYSKFQEGYFGFYRLERAGVLYDKYIALLALTLRNWNTGLAADERFFINFYDLWPVEMTEFFTGMIMKEPKWYAPRMRFDDQLNPVVQNLPWFRAAGSCEDINDDPIPCRGPQFEEETSPAIDGTSNEILRDFATIFASAFFPVYYDTSFEQRLAVFKRGSGDGWDIPDVQPDGEPTCAYGETIDPDHVTGCLDPDYVVFSSDRFRTQYIAVKVRSRRTYNLDEEQVSYQLLKAMVDRQRRYRALKAQATRTEEEQEEMEELERRLNADNSFLEFFIDIQRQFGIFIQ